MSLTPEEGAALSRLAGNPRGLTQFAPAAADQSGYRSFNTDVVWPLEQLRSRGFVEIVERVPADNGDAYVYWNSITAALTLAGREAAAGRPRDSRGPPGMPDG